MRLASFCLLREGRGLSVLRIAFMRLKYTETSPSLSIYHSGHARQKSQNPRLTTALGNL